jgi:hypothetical protein
LRARRLPRDDRAAIPRREGESGPASFLDEVAFLNEPMPSETRDTNGETVDRPEPGLARGRWEAPPWFFYAVLVLAIVGSAAWVFGARRRRHGRLRARNGR